MRKRRKQKQKDKMRKKKEAMICRGEKYKRKRLRGGKMKNRCTKGNEKNMECKKLIVMLRKDRKQEKKKEDK